MERYYAMIRHTTRSSIPTTLDQPTSPDPEVGAGTGPSVGVPGAGACGCACVSALFGVDVYEITGKDDWNDEAELLTCVETNVLANASPLPETPSSAK